MSENAKGDGRTAGRGKRIGPHGGSSRVSNRPPVIGERNPDGEVGDGAMVRRPGIMTLCALGYMLLVWYLALVPMEFERFTLAEGWRQFTELPLLARTQERLPGLMTHLVAMLPLGFLLAIGILSFRDPAAKLVFGALAWLIIVLFPIAIEFTQLWATVRVSTWSDVYTGWVGLVLGWAAGGLSGAAILRALGAMVDPFRRAEARKALLSIYPLALVFFLLLPFDLRLNLSVLERKWNDGLIILRPFAYDPDAAWAWWFYHIRKLLIWLPVALWLRLGWDYFRLGPRTLGETAVLMAVFTVMVEIARLPLASAMSDVTSPLLGIMAALLAHLLIGRVVDQRGGLRMGKHWSSGLRFEVGMAFGWLYLAVVGGLLTRPWRLRLEWSYIQERWMSMIDWPFASMYWAGEWRALQKFTIMMLLMAPAGAFFAFALDGRLRPGRAIWLVVGLVLGFGLAVEMLQGVMESDRYGSPTPSLTDCIAYGGGAALGWLGASAFLPRRISAKRDVADASLAVAGVDRS